MRSFFFIVAGLSLSACSTLGLDKNVARAVPQSVAAQQSGYTYIPVDPLRVRGVPDYRAGDECVKVTFNEGTEDEYEDTVFRDLLDSLPDNAVRVAIQRTTVNGDIVLGPVGVGARDEAFKITADFINADTIPAQMDIRRYYVDSSGKEVSLPVYSRVPYNIDPEAILYDVIIQNVEAYRIEEKAVAQGSERFYIPVYVGVGLRIVADVRVTGAKAKIGGLGAIGGEVEAENLSGDIVTQTLGISGKAVTTALPIQTELNQSTIQNAIVAVGSIKAQLYSDDTIASPRVVGFYLPLPANEALVNAIVSGLVKAPPVWPRLCRLKDPGKSDEGGTEKAKTASPRSNRPTEP